MDLSNYVLVQRYALPEPTRTAAPPNNVLAQEASAVTFNWDTNTLFITGDGGRSITEVSKTGQLISTMTLALGGSPQGTEFYDPEGLTYIGNGQFVMTEERDRNVVLFTYQANTTLTRAAAKTVDLGTFSPNEGLEGISYDPLTGGFILAKEVNPQGLFQTMVNFNAGTATNGSSTTENAVNLFDPALLGVIDLADVFALSNLPALNGTAEGARLLVLSQESARILEVDRAGTIYSQLVINAAPGDTISSSAMQHEGLTMDRNGFLYVVNENGGGDINHPELWVYAPSHLPNQAPTALTLTNPVTVLPENTATGSRVQVAGVQVTDDGLGTNTLAITGADAAFFEVDNTGLDIKAGVALDFETRSSYSVTVTVNDASVGTTPDASATYSLTLTDVVNETATPGLVISEVAPWSSGNSPVGADWFELTNNGTTAVNVTGWKFDDNSHAFGSAVTLTGVTTIKPGESVIFLETADLAATKQAFINTWFDGTAPVGLQIGAYSGGGVGLSTGGDEVNVYDATGALKAALGFGLSPSGPFTTFDNAKAFNNTTINTPTMVGVYGGFVAAQDSAEIGSPGSAGGILVTEVAPWSSGGPVGADWFEVTNTTAFTVDLTGWKMDDNSESPAAAVALSGVTALAPGDSAIFLETSTLAATRQAFINFWFGGTAPAGLQIGGYSGSGVGLSTSSDAVNLYDAGNNLRASFSFGASSSGPFTSFDNFAGVNRAPVTTQAATGIHGAFNASADAATIGSPGTIGKIFISEVAPWSSGNGPIGADWFEVTNGTGAAIDITGWKMDDNSNSFANAIALTGVTTLAAGQSAIFFETTNLAATRQLFIDTWFNGVTPTGVQFGAYSGGGVGLGTGGDAVNLYDSSGGLRANVTFGASPTGPFATFDNAGARNGTITALSAVGVQGGFVASDDPSEIGSPGGVFNQLPLFTSPSALSVIENTTFAGTVIATDRENSIFSFALTGGVDRNQFTIDSATGQISFLNVPDFETQDDADHNGIYRLQVTATDGQNGQSTQTLAITVTNVDEPGLVLNFGGGNDRPIGGLGDDIINAGDGDDIVSGGDGNDSIAGGSGNDFLVGGRGADTIDGGDGDDQVNGGAGNNILRGGDGNDTLSAVNGNNLLEGGNGDDVLRAGSGDNILKGGAGNDTFIFQVLGAKIGHDTIQDFQAGDHITIFGAFGNFQAVQAAMHQDGNNVVIQADGNGTLTLTDQLVGNLQIGNFSFA